MKKKLLLLVAFFNVTMLLAFSIDTLKVYSKSMNKSILNIVLLPDNYSSNREYPTLYLLHGAGGDYTSWSSLVPSIQHYVNRYDMIIVCPDGASTSWYFDSPIDKKFKYETYVSKELIEAVDKSYSTIQKNQLELLQALVWEGMVHFISPLSIKRYGEQREA